MHDLVNIFMNWLNIQPSPITLIQLLETIIIIIFPHLYNTFYRM